MLFLEPWSKPLLFAHLIAAIAACSSAVHVGCRLYLLMRGRPGLLKSLQLHARILALSYALAFVLGALIYPVFRIRVRHEFLESAFPAGVGLFELKEHFAALALIPAIGVWMILRAWEPRIVEDRQSAPVVYAMLAVVLAALGYNAWSGWYLGSLRSI